MATVFYDKASVNVQWGTVNETLLASNFTVNLSTSAQPVYAIGSKGPLGQFPSSARVGDVSFGFITSLTGMHYGQKGNIINFLASGIKHSVGSVASGVTISGAGVKGIGFLNSYSLNVASNSVSSSSASFTFFGSGSQLPVSGRLADSVEFPHRQSQGNIGTGVVHGRYTPLTTLRTTIGAGNDPDPTDVGTVFGADYSINFNHNPIYKVGQEFPVTSLYTTAQESVNVTEDIFNSGLAFDETSDDYTIDLHGLDTSASTANDKMQLKMISGKQVSTSMSAGLDDIVRSQKTLTASY